MTFPVIALSRVEYFYNILLFSMVAAPFLSLANLILLPFAWKEMSQLKRGTVLSIVRIYFVATAIITTGIVLIFIRMILFFRFNT